jgi:hypothetical protein
MNAALQVDSNAVGSVLDRFPRRPSAPLIILVLIMIRPVVTFAGSEKPQVINDPSLSALPPASTSAASFLSQHLPALVFCALIILVAVMFAWFVNVFTTDLNPANPPDADTRNKVRKMVVFCYIFMLLTLAVAISPFLLLMLLPQGVVSAVYSYMPDSPVALVVGCVHDDKAEDAHWEIVCQPRDPYMDEWLITIGGLVLTAGGGGPSALLTTGADAATKHPTADKAGLPSKVDQSPPAAQRPADPLQVGSSTLGVSPAPAPSPPEFAPEPWTPDINLTSEYWNFPLAVVHGGITVPLYFIIVALIGASIGLTRRVPEYQKQFLDASKPFAASEMREHLVLQILQFLSAPFLAIAGYILLTPAGPTTSIPLAFVAGFSSETVLRVVTSAIKNLEASKP